MVSLRSDVFLRDPCVHNGTTAGPDFEFVTDAVQWSYSVSVPFTMPPPPPGDVEAVITLEVLVTEGIIGVGILDASLQNYISPEIDVRPAGSPLRIELRPAISAADAHMMIRTIADGGVRARFRVLDLSVEHRPADRRLLVPRSLELIPADVVARPTHRGTFDLLISHSSRTWNGDQCDRDYLARRYATPGRLDGLPPFESLTPNNAPYYGLLTVFRVSLTDEGVHGKVLQHFVSPEKIVHAALVGGTAVVCFDAGVALFDRDADIPGVAVIPESATRVVDPWFGGLHTVMAATDTTCLLSSSGADAILWLDLQRGQVVRRWRLPASRYGVNYPLDETTCLSEHYIPNDMQLGHLNCACPDDAGGAFFSVLAQGDVGRVDADGHCDVLVTGYVGAHGVRYDATAKLLHFVDSCRGRLMRIDGPDQTTVLFDAGNRWLHDAIHVGDGLFFLTLGDRNQLVLADTNAGRRIAEWDFSAVGGSIQFLSLAGS